MGYTGGTAGSTYSIGTKSYVCGGGGGLAGSSGNGSNGANGNTNGDFTANGGGTNLAPLPRYRRKYY